ncbi:MAG: cyclic nucleotide-binding domain-containing protein [Anaerolineales bacterium]|nr:cyclic nucleotide-binding domain-containing protein [Anaerolineales bacterium]
MELFSRDELLSGELNRSRRAARLLMAIEARCAYLRDESRRVVEAYFLEGSDDFQRRFIPCYIENIKLTAGGADQALHYEHLEHYAAQWKSLLPAQPAANPELYARLLHQMHCKYAITPHTAPRSMACLGADNPGVQAAYQDLFGKSLSEAMHETSPKSPDELPLSEQIAAHLEWLNLQAGEVLFRAGDPGDALYVVISGRMQVISEDKDRQARVLVEIGRGEMLGEMAILTGEPRNATIRAARDSELVRLGRDDLFALARQHLQVLVQVSATCIQRLNRQLAGLRRAPGNLLTFALLPCDECVSIEAFGRNLSDVLCGLGSTAYVTSRQLDEVIEPGASQLLVDDPRNPEIVSWLAEIETRHRYVIYQAEALASSWSRRCIRQADRVVLVGLAGTDPQPSADETALLAEWAKLHEADGTFAGTNAKDVELVLLHDSSVEMAGATALWLAPRRLSAHHHVRLGSLPDFERLARRLVGYDLGLVLSGGGARGFGHIGVLRALRELNIAIDRVGGTSMGALMGAAFARGMDDQDLTELAQHIGSRELLLDRTLPIISFYTTRKITDLIQNLSSGLDIEDLWLPYFCISCNLSKGSQMVHTRGPVWLAIRASMAAMPIFTPILHEGDLLVDGGFLNNLPVDVMRQQFGSATVLGIDCSPLSPKTQEYDFGPSISGWEALRYQLQPRLRRKAPPTLLRGLTQIMDTNGIYRQQFTKDDADLIVRLPARGWGMLDFDHSAEIIEASYRAACEQLAGWRPNSFQE